MLTAEAWPYKLDSWCPSEKADTHGMHAHSVLGRERQPSLLGEFQDSERPCLKKMANIRGMVSSSPSTSTYIQPSPDLADPAITGFLEAAM